MRRSEVKPKSVRKALRDVSNNNGGGRFSRSMTTAKKKFVEKVIEDRHRAQEQVGQEDDDGLDRLLLVQADLSALVRQIDELVVQAFKSKSNEGKKEVAAFERVLSDMLSSLKPWIPRFEKVISSNSVQSENQSRKSLVTKTVSTVNEVKTEVLGSPDQKNFDSLISPSPLVSWHANCRIDRGRQLFLLTPLPISKSLSSKYSEPPKSAFKRISSKTAGELPSFGAILEDGKHDLLEGVPMQPLGEPSDKVTIEISGTSECASLQMSSKGECSTALMTPCWKGSPPKSCVLVEEISETAQPWHDKFRKSTPYPVGHGNGSGLDSSESSGNEYLKDLALKYPELLGIQEGNKSGITKKNLEESPDWFTSPPKTCILLEPPDDDEKTLDNGAANDVLHKQTNLSVLKEIDDHPTETSSLQEPQDDSFKVVESTPMWKEPESTFRRGKHPGENTLKKELWTRFEAASTKATSFDISVHGGTGQKGFLDRLEEACCDDEV